MRFRAARYLPSPPLPSNGVRGLTASIWESSQRPRVGSVDGDTRAGARRLLTAPTTVRDAGLTAPSTRAPCGQLGTVLEPIKAMSPNALRRVPGSRIAFLGCRPPPWRTDAAFCEGSSVQGFRSAGIDAARAS